MKELSLTPGLEGKATTTVNQQNTAQAVGSGSLEVFATPMMVALMEEAAVNCLAEFLPEGITSVGTKISTTHTSPTPLDKTITATATITAVDRRRVDFAVTAEDEAGSIGVGTHSRFLVESEAFLKTAQNK